MRLINADKLADNMTALLERNRSLVDEWLAVRIVDEITETQPLDAVQVVRCKDCKWFDKTEDSSYGYCHAMKHGYYSKNWEISIYRKYKEDFYCADGEVKDEADL